MFLATNILAPSVASFVIYKPINTYKIIITSLIENYAKNTIVRVHVYLTKCIFKIVITNYLSEVDRSITGPEIHII